jgi:hypothetical protein
MANRYSIGDKVLASRDESGENHEPGNVVDSYELIIGDDRKPMVVVEFEDGERKYMTATTPNVLPVDEEEEAEAEVEEPEELEAEEGDEAVDADAEAEDEVFFSDEEEGASP